MSKLNNYDVIIIHGPNGIGKITLAMKLMSNLTSERNIGRFINSIDGDGILYTEKPVDVNLVNKFKSKLVIATPLEDIFDGLDDKLTKKVKHIHLKKIPYLVYSVINDSEFDI